MISILTFIYAGCVEMMGSAFDGTTKAKVSLYDHRTYHLHEDDYLRVCQIPKRKVGHTHTLYIAWISLTSCFSVIQILLTL